MPLKLKKQYLLLHLCLYAISEEHTNIAQYLRERFDSSLFAFEGSSAKTVYAMISKTSGKCLNTSCGRVCQ